MKFLLVRNSWIDGHAFKGHFSTFQDVSEQNTEKSFRDFSSTPSKLFEQKRFVFFTLHFLESQLASKQRHNGAKNFLKSHSILLISRKSFRLNLLQIVVNYVKVHSFLKQCFVWSLLDKILAVLPNYFQAQLKVAPNCAKQRSCKILF